MITLTVGPYTGRLPLPVPLLLPGGPDSAAPAQERGRGVGGEGGGVREGSVEGGGVREGSVEGGGVREGLVDGSAGCAGPSGAGAATTIAHGTCP